MRINQQHPDFDKLLVYLDGMWVRSALEADDVEGWVIIPDLAALAPLPKEQDNFDTDFAPGEEVVDEWEQMKTLKKFGRVEFRHIPK